MQPRGTPKARAARRLLLLALFGGLLGAAAPGGAARAAEESGFAVPVGLFVQEPATGYGMYKPRTSTAFKGGETLFFYLEPANFGYAAEGELHRFGALVDLRIKEGDKTVFSKDAFLDARFLSHHRNREINFSGRLNVEGAPKGTYRLELVVRDSVSDKSALVDLPFSIE